jgi:hypothetical protein
MNLPGFTAEAALYQTSGQYRAGRYATTLAAQMTRAIYPAREVIEVHSCRPGSSLVEYDDGTWECLPNEEPGWGGGPGAAGYGGEPGGGGSAGRPSKKPPKRPPKPPRKDIFRPEQGKPCHAEVTTEGGGTEEIISKGSYHFFPSEGPAYGWWCNYDSPAQSRIAHCNTKEVKGGVTKTIRCYNGHE